MPRVPSRTSVNDEQRRLHVIRDSGAEDERVRGGQVRGGHGVNDGGAQRPLRGRCAPPHQRVSARRGRMLPVPTLLASYHDR